MGKSGNHYIIVLVSCQLYIYVLETMLRISHLEKIGILEFGHNKFDILNFMIENGPWSTGSDQISQFN